MHFFNYFSPLFLLVNLSPKKNLFASTTYTKAPIVKYSKYRLLITVSHRSSWWDRKMSHIWTYYHTSNIYWRYA